jgi:hypothetical protein
VAKCPVFSNAELGRLGIRGGYNLLNLGCAKPNEVTEVIWWDNAAEGNGATGGAEYDTTNLIASGLPIPFYRSDTDLAFDVLGDPTPEPGGFCLLAAGLFGLSLLKLASRPPKRKTASDRPQDFRDSI